MSPPNPFPTRLSMQTQTSMTTDEIAEWVISLIENMTDEERLSARVALMKEFFPERIRVQPKLVM